MSSKALVIKNVDFGMNKLATVSLENDVSCTAISLSDSTASLTAIGAQKTLTATKTPSNATDAITWSSSNTDVVTVVSGVVTQTGVGTAVVTVTCGSYSASCTFTTVNTLPFVYDIGKYNSADESSAHGDFVGLTTYTSSYCAISSETATTKEIKSSSDPKYFLRLGTGASTLTITVPSAIRATVWFADCETSCDFSNEHPDYAIYGKLISGDASPYSGAVSVGPRTVSVPSGANSVAISLHYPNGEITDAIMDTVAIVAS